MELNLEGLSCVHCQSSNMVAVEVRRLYDGALFWECLECGGTQHRWSRYDACGLHEKAIPYIHGPTRKAG